MEVVRGPIVVTNVDIIGASSLSDNTIEDNVHELGWDKVESTFGSRGNEVWLIGDEKL